MATPSLMPPPPRGEAHTEGVNALASRRNEESALGAFSLTPPFLARGPGLSGAGAAASSAGGGLLVEAPARPARPPDASFKVPLLSKDLAPVEKAFEQVQAELRAQARRQDEACEAASRIEADLGRLAKMAVENEGLHAAERHQKHVALQSLTRRTEDALLTCESLRKGQDHLVAKVEHLEGCSGSTEQGTEDTARLRNEFDSLQTSVRETLDAVRQALRRMDAMEQIFDENTKLRQEVAQLRRASERRDLEMAAVQGQIDALTKLVREQAKQPASPPRFSSAKQ